MKKLNFTAIVLFFCTFIFGQNKIKVPSIILNSFERSYPNINGSWEKEDQNYEVEFLYDHHKMSILYSNKGIRLETETQITLTELPQIAQEYLKKNYGKSKIKEVAKLVDASGIQFFEVELKDLEMIFDSTGKFKESKKD